MIEMVMVVAYMAFYNLILQPIKIKVFLFFINVNKDILLNTVGTYTKNIATA